MGGSDEMGKAGTPLPCERVGGSPPARRLELPVATLVWLATAAILLPSLLLGSFGLARWAAAERAEQIERVTSHAHLLARAVDRELRGFIETAEVLAESRSLKLGDIRIFSEQTRDTVLKTGGAIVVHDSAMRRIVDTRGRPSPDRVDLATASAAMARRVLETGEPVIGGLEREPDAPEHSFPVIVPVIVDRMPRYVLSYTPRPGTIQQVVQQSGLLEGWRASVIDGVGRILARSEKQAEFVGKSGSAAFVARVLAGHWGVLDSTDLEGHPSVTAYHASQLADWRVLVWVPKTVLEAPARSAMQLAAVLTALALLATFAAAWLGARLITRPTRQLAALAEALGTGEPVLPVPGVMREANIVGSALADAAAEIALRESRLRESETRFRNMANHAPVMIRLTEADGATAFLSQSWYDFTGEPSGSGMGLGWLAAVHADDRGRVAQTIAEVRRAGEPLEIEYRLRRSDRTHAWVLDTAHPRIGPDGGILGDIGSIIDITERRLNERDTAFQLALSERLLSFQGSQSALLAALSTDVRLHLGVDGVQFCRKQGDRLVPLVRRRDPGAPNGFEAIAIDTLSPQTVAETRDGRILVVADSAADPRTRDYYDQGYAPIGLRSYIVAPLLGQFGMHACIIVMSSAPRNWQAREIALVGAIAERVWGQVERMRLDERLRIAVDGARLGLYERDLRTGIGYWAPSTRALYGAPDELETNTEEQWLALVHADDRSGVRASLDAARRGEPLESEFRVLDRQRGDRWIASRGEVHQDEESGETRLIGICFDVTERKATEATLRENEQRMRLALDAGRMGAWTWQLDGRSEVDDMTLELFGLTREDWQDDPQALLSRVLPEDKPVFDAACAAAVDHGEPYASEFRVVLPDGSTRWLAGRGRVERDANGRSLMIRGVSYDVTGRKQREAENLLLLREVNHRSKNMLAQVLAMARQTTAPTTAEYVKRLTDRVQALAASQDLLVSSDWRGAGMRELVIAQLAQFKDLVGTRISLTGPELELLPSAVQSIGMALHELASNAGRHGALSGPTGRVAITWALVGSHDRRMNLTWSETGGSPIDPAPRRGFGSTVAGAMIRLSLQGTIELEVSPAGLAWRLECPAENAVDMSGTEKGGPAPSEQRRIETH